MTGWEIGNTNNKIVVETSVRPYTVYNLIGKDDLCNIYRCEYSADEKTWEAMFRVARDAADNDLVLNEARILYHLQSTYDYADFKPFLPAVLEAFIYQDAHSTYGRQVNILSLHEQIASPLELYTFEEVHQHYRSGINPRDMAWMLRRLLNVLGFAHHNGVVHGAVLPSHVLIEPRDHKLALTGWPFAVRTGSDDHIKALSISYEDWYPAEVREKKPATPGLDFFLMARTVMYLLGGDPLRDTDFPALEPEFQRFFEPCLDPNPAKRPQDAWVLLGEFDRILEHVWGGRRFHVFTMPPKI